MQLFNASGRPRNSTEAPDAPGHQYWATILEDAGFCPTILPASGGPWARIAGRHNAYLGLDPFRALRVLLTSRDAALVCAHLESAVVLLLLRRLFRFRPPVVVWEVPWSPGWRFRDIVTRLAVPRADCCVVFSSSQIERIHRSFGRQVPAVFVPFCVDTRFFQPRPTPAETTPYILSCGLDAGRDFEIVLRASLGVNAPFFIKTRNLPSFDPARFPNVTFSSEHLSYPKYRDMYAAAAIVVVATHDTPNASGVTTLMEAMAMGKPTIVSDNPALRDYLPPEDAGIVIPVGDAAALQEAIVNLICNPGRASAMGRRARRFAETRFSPKRHFQLTAELFDEIATRAGRDT